MGNEQNKANASIEVSKQNSKFFIQINNSSWGANCDGYVTSKKTHKDGKVTYPKTISVGDNNMLRKVSRMCNNKTSCVFEVSNKYLGEVKTNRCRKEFTVGYRCFRIDKLRNSDVKDGKKVIIDCRESTIEKETSSAKE